MTDFKERFRRVDDNSLLPDEHQMAQMEYILNMSPDEQERVKLFMTIQTRDILFGHINEETSFLKTMGHKVDNLHAAIYGVPGDAESRGALKTLGEFTKTMDRINTWLDGGCFVLKTVLPWATGLVAASLTIAKMLGFW